MEIRLDPATLPKNGQEIKFQTVIDEDYGTWQEGVYNARMESIVVSPTLVYDMWGDVVRWEPLEN